MPIPVPGGDEARSIVIEQYGGLNTQAKRTSIGDNEFSWLENLYPIGDGNMRTLYAEGATLYTAPMGLTILHYVSFNIEADSFIAVFLDDGTAQQVNVDTAVVVDISATPNTFYDGTNSIPAAAQWKSELLIIVSDVADNGYWIWNGSELFTSGTLSPDIIITNGGRSYTSAPTVTAYGGSGTGAMFSATVANGEVVEIVCTDPGSGYVLNDQPVLAVAGGGSDDGAAVVPTVTVTSAGVERVEVILAGAGYPAGSVIVFSGGGGSGAEAVITANNGGSVYEVTVINPGSGYTSAPAVVCTGVGGTGWSGVAFVVRGQVTGFTVAAGGSGYDAPPTVTVVGNGRGATARATLTAGAVSAVTIVNPGLGYTFAKVVLTNGNDAATAQCSLMPFGIAGTTVETYQSRVWVGDVTRGHFTAPASTSVFATSAGGGTYPATESFLRERITRFFQSNGFLYQLGDSSINVISNVQTANNPPTTTFNNANVDPQVGTPWPNSVQAFGRALVFANSLGVYALYGGAAEKVSAQLDALFQNGDFSTVTPTASIATIFGIRCYCLLMRTTDPYSGTPRNIMCMWDGQKWFASTQLVTLSQVGTQEIDSIIETWGCDGTHLFKNFQTPSATLSKVWQTKLRAGESYLVRKQINRFALLAQSNHADGAAFTIRMDTIDVENGYLAGGAVTVPGAFALTPRLVTFDDPGLDNYGNFLGITGTTTSKDATIMSQTQFYRDYAPDL